MDRRHDRRRRNRLCDVHHPEVKTNDELVENFENNVRLAEKALENATDAGLDADFSLKRNGQILYTAPKRVDIGTSLNHWIHHRGQLTVCADVRNPGAVDLRIFFGAERLMPLRLRTDCVSDCSKVPRTAKSATA